MSCVDPSRRESIPPLDLHANVVRLGSDNGEMFLHENEDGSDWIVESLGNRGTYV